MHPFILCFSFSVFQTHTHSSLKRQYTTLTDFPHNTTAAPSLAGNRWGENIRSLVCMGSFLRSFSKHHQNSLLYVFQPMTHFQANLRKPSHFAGEMAPLIERTPVFSLSSSFHACSAYPLSSNLVLLCHWWAGAIIGSLRLKLEQNVRQFKAACQSAFLYRITTGAPEAFHCIYLPNWGAQRQRQEKECPTYLWITLTPLLLFMATVVPQQQYIIEAIIYKIFYTHLWCREKHPVCH